MKKILGMGIVLFFCSWSIGWSETLHLLTEDYPPFNMRVSGESIGNADDPITGISTEIVRELFKRAGIEYTIRIYAWNRSYNMALQKSGHGVFSTFRTPEREQLFNWVGPLVSTSWILMGKKNRNIKISTLDDARKYKIGGCKGDAFAIFLEKKGFKIEYAISEHLNARKLDGEKIDLWATVNLLGPYLAKKEGLSVLEQVFMIKESFMYLALNKSVSTETVAKLNKIFEEMKADGTVDQIFSNYR
ncbi:substrate-binding periplasmic protein [Desulfonema magnum]|uniref:Extracellular solute-binding protein, family 3 n=1 Tax=Desulfonema magnum TaxID=45655 RepID=A0A975GKS4_9BACT|nr:transporter substrate-binding domain-containing protein [Desulfonema magnum]QTA84088.1 Extracellular solute-binding protein, family 3 [Desulfonema magnum]